MATQTELGIKIDDFMGVNTLVTSDDVQQNYFLKTQNLYERRIGELQPKGGQELLYSSLPALTDFNHGTQFLDKNEGRSYVVGGRTHTIKRFPYATTITDGAVSMAFGAGGDWGTSFGATIASSFIGCTEIQLVGYGKNLWAKCNTALTTGLPVSGDAKKLTVTFSGAPTSWTLSGVEVVHVYAKINYAWTGGTPATTYIFVGSIRLSEITGATTRDFTVGPLHLPVDPGLDSAGKLTPPTYAISEKKGLGTLKKGTYYVCLLNHVVDNETAIEAEKYSILSNETGDIKVITVDDNGRIEVDCSTGGFGAGAPVTALAIGRTPITMSVVGLISINNKFIYNIDKLPENGAVCKTTYSGANPVADAELGFRSSSFSNTCWLGKESGSRVDCINLSNPLGDHDGANIPTAASSNAADTWNSYSDLYPEPNPVYEFVQHKFLGQDVIFFVVRPDREFSATFAKNQALSNVFMYDGHECVRLISTYNKVTIPRMDYISAFEERLVGSDGSKVLFTNVGDPGDWSVPGAPSIQQYINIQSGEDISGIGLYTNTSGDSGPQAKLLVLKPTSTWVIGSMPVYTAGSNNNAALIQLSGRIGGYHRTIQNTSIGTMMAGQEGVYLVREDGEPLPISDQIKYELTGQDPNWFPNPEKWSSSVHDDHYKLAIQAVGSGAFDDATIEWWLNITKMKALKGQSAWYGPQIGRTIKSSFNIEPFNTVERPRRVVMTDTLLLESDKADVLDDYVGPIAVSLESPDLRLRDGNTNMLYTRTLWMLKVDETLDFTETTTVLSRDGEETETNVVTIPKIPTHAGPPSYTSFLAARQKLYEVFPTVRLRGETIKKILSISSVPYHFAISGFTTHFRKEGRRVD